MTTQVPVPQHPPVPTYPTAPPWATPAPAPAAPKVPAEAVRPWGTPLPDHGRLLVPYPEEMENASRAEPPPWWPVVVWTLFLGVFAVLPAARRATQARQGRNSSAPYWVAWGATLSLVVALGAMIASIGMPAYLNYRENAATKLVQENILTDGQLEASAQVTPTTANCEPSGERDAAGFRRYECLLTLDDGRTGSLVVSADTDGNWTAVAAKKVAARK